MSERFTAKKARECAGESCQRAVVSFVDAGLFSTDEIAEELPSFTRIELSLKPGPGSNLRVEVWLPEKKNWNGNFVGTGNGGMAGSIRYDRLLRFLRMGYACANTDMGTSGGKTSGYENPDMQKDFGWRATHLMTVAAKELVEEFYGKSAARSYFVGASTGGQQAFSEAERFPEDYDGILACVPAFYRTAIHMYFVWSFVHLHDGEGNPLFTIEEAREISSLAPLYFSKKGGASEGDAFVSFPWHGKDTPEAFVSWLSGRCAWMNERKKEALIAVYTGPSDPETGKKIYCGMPIGTELEEGGLGTFLGEKCLNFYPFLWAFGPEMTPAKFDFSKDAKRMQELLSEHMDATNADLAPFKERGGKMIGYSGSSDPWVPFPMSFDFVEKIAKNVGGEEELLSFLRYYLIPGRAHHGGPGATDLYTDESMEKDVFDALTLWVEQGKAPERLIAGGNGIVRAVYPYGSREFPFTEHQRT